jgi:hypothetical protein
MTNEEAIQRLVYDGEDTMTLIAIAKNNANVLKAAVTRYFTGSEVCEKALLILPIRISRRVKYFVRGHDVADLWIEECVEMECRRLRNEFEAHESQRRGVTVLLRPGLDRFVAWPEKCSDSDEENLRSPGMLPLANEGRWN